MEFNLLVKTQLFPILKSYGFKITEDFKNIIRFESNIVKLNIIFDEYDHSHFVEIGKLKETLYPLNDGVIKELLGTELPMEQVTPEVFIQNLSVLFKTTKGIEILNGNINLVKNIIIQQSENYTSKLILNQVLEKALKAWE